VKPEHVVSKQFLKATVVSSIRQIASHRENLSWEPVATSICFENLLEKLLDFLK